MKTQTLKSGVRLLARYQRISGVRAAHGRLEGAGIRRRRVLISRGSPMMLLSRPLLVTVTFASRGAPLPLQRAALQPRGDL